MLQDRHVPTALIERYVNWCSDFVAYHQRRAPQEMGALQVEQYLLSLRQERGLAEEARAALVVLYRDVLGRSEALQSRLLERVQAVLRVLWVIETLRQG